MLSDSSYTESWLKPKNQFELNGFNVIRKDRIGKTGGRVIMFIAKSLKYIVIEVKLNDSNSEVICVEITNLTLSIPTWGHSGTPIRIFFMLLSNGYKCIGGYVHFSICLIIHSAK